VTDRRPLDELLAADRVDPGCDAGIPILDEYVELELAGEEPARRFPGTAAHLQTCSACRADHDGLLEAARRFSDETIDE
jgi:predicted anti-sigma-YlaC factor YlaD